MNHISRRDTNIQEGLAVASIARDDPLFPTMIPRLACTELVQWKYTVSQKNDNDVLRYNFYAHQPILILFGRDTAE